MKMIEVNTKPTPRATQPYVPLHDTVEGIRVGEHRRRDGQRQDAEPGERQEHQAAHALEHGVRPAVPRHRPGDVGGVLGGLTEAERAVRRGERADHDRRRAALQAPGASELVAHDGELAQRRVEQPFAQGRVVLEEEAQDRGGDEQQREDRDERVERDDRREVRTLVVEVLVDDRQREADDRVASLEPVDRSRTQLLMARYGRSGMAAAATASNRSRSSTEPSRRTVAGSIRMSRLRRTSLGRPLESHGPGPRSYQ